MSSTIHVNEANLLPGKAVDFAFATDAAPYSFYSRPQHRENANTRDQQNTSFDETSLRAFHEEFKSLVLADDELFEIDWAAELCDQLDRWDASTPVGLTIEEATPCPAPTLDVVKAPARQQVVRPLTESQLGRPMPIETWVVKVIVVLVGLNLLFAGIIVTGVRLSDLFK